MIILLILLIIAIWSYFFPKILKTPEPVFVEVDAKQQEENIKEAVNDITEHQQRVITQLKDYIDNEKVPNYTTNSIYNGTAVLNDYIYPEEQVTIY